MNQGELRQRTKAREKQMKSVTTEVSRDQEFRNIDRTVQSVSPPPSTGDNKKQGMNKSRGKKKIKFSHSGNRFRFMIKNLEHQSKQLNP